MATRGDWTVDSVSARLPDRLKERARDTNSNIYQLILAWKTAWYDKWSADLEDLEEQLKRESATGQFLRRFARFWRSRVKDDDDDDRIRFFLGLELLARRGGVGIFDIKELVAAMLDTSPNQITVVENQDVSTGEYVPFQFYVEFDQSLLGTAGFDTDEYADVVSDMDAFLDHVAGVGIKGFVNTTGGALYDTAEYDGDDAYGS